ncbi:MAG: hypothetical protein LBV27_03680 [Oscillospiraceae bacterium]|jgi:hypothetical protein|nr:hypothetical protein [Oscillospiraceae bacterium]
MTVKDMAQSLSLAKLAGEENNDVVTGCYIGDLLSWVMGRAGEGNAWITVMGNINAVAVAKLAELSCIILCEDAHLDEDARIQADSNGIAIYASGETAYALAVKIAALLAG